MMVRKQVVAVMMQDLRSHLGHESEAFQKLALANARESNIIYESVFDTINSTIEAHLRDVAIGKGVGQVYFEEDENWWKQGGDNDDVWKNASWTRNVVITRYRYATLTKVWLSEDEWNRLETNAMKKLWAQRMRNLASGPTLVPLLSVVRVPGPASNMFGR